MMPTGQKVGSTRPGLPRDGLSFRVKFPVAIEQLGLSQKALKTYLPQLQPGANVTVEIVDALSAEILAQANFTQHILDTVPSDDGFIYLKVEEENLPKGFEGILRIRPHLAQESMNQLKCNIDWNKIFGDDGPIVWTGSFFHARAKPSVQNFCPLMTLLFSIPDLMELKQICVALDTQNKCQVSKVSNNLLYQI